VAIRRSSGFSLAFRNKDLMLFSFLSIISTVSVSENLLDVDKGLIFYALFFSFFVISSQKVPAAAIEAKLKVII